MSERFAELKESLRKKIQQMNAMRKPKTDSRAFEAEKSAPADTVQVKINNKASFISDFIEF